MVPAARDCTAWVKMRCRCATAWADPKNTRTADMEAYRPSYRRDSGSAASHVARRKRTNQTRTDDAPAKRVRSRIHEERKDEERREDVPSVLKEEFAEKERLSYGKEWCMPIPPERRASAVQAFYRAFYDADTPTLWACRIFY